MKVIKLLSAFTLALALLMPTESPPRAYAQDTVKYWAVIVGVADYPGTADDLSYTADDAIELRSQLAPIWGADHIKLLLDSQATKADEGDGKVEEEEIIP